MKLIVALIMMFTISSFSQPYVSVSSEVVNSTFGSSDTEGNGKLNFLVKAGVVADDIKVGLSISHLQSFYLQTFSFDVGRRLYIGQDIEITPAVSFGVINRDSQAFFYHGIELENNYFLIDKLAISLTLKLNSRSDLDYMGELMGGDRNRNYRSEIYLGVFYKF